MSLWTLPWTLRVVGRILRSILRTFLYRSLRRPAASSQLKTSLQMRPMSFILTWPSPLVRFSLSFFYVGSLQHFSTRNFVIVLDLHCVPHTSHMEDIKFIFLPRIGNLRLTSIHEVAEYAGLVETLSGLLGFLVLFYTRGFSLAMSVAALATLPLISGSMDSELEMVDPRSVKFSKTPRVYPSMAMFGGVSVFCEVT